jgi:hypothetical protein
VQLAHVKLTQWSLAFALIAAIGLLNCAEAAEGTPTGSASVSDAPTSGWKMPRLWPAKSAATAKKPAGPSTWQRMSSGTRTFFAKTADVLNPWDDAEEKESLVPSGSGSAFRRASAKKEESSGKFSLPSWSWGSDAKESKPKTVNDFLSQPRPDF